MGLLSSAPGSPWKRQEKASLNQTLGLVTLPIEPENSQTTSSY